MRSTKIVVASAVSRLATMLSGAPPQNSLPTMVAQTKSPKELPNDRERENKWVYRSVVAFWRSVFTLFMEGVAAYGAMMHGISFDAVLIATRCSSWRSAGRTTFEAAHEHGPYLKSEHSDAVELDRVATTPVGHVAEIG
jgi:hypothetical protein